MNHFEQKRMTQVLLPDLNVPAFISSCGRYFTYDIDSFLEAYQQSDPDSKELEQLIQSRNGSYVNACGFSQDDPEHNMIQTDTAEIYETKTYHFNKERDIVLLNIYGWETRLRVKYAEFELQSIRFKSRYYIIGRYQLSGVAVYNSFHEGFEHLVAYGNPIVRINNVAEHGGFYTGKLIDEKDLHFDKYKDNSAYSFCYVTVETSGEKLQLPKRMSSRVLCLLMRDIPGEAG